MDGESYHFAAWYKHLSEHLTTASWRASRKWTMSCWAKTMLPSPSMRWRAFFLGGKWKVVKPVSRDTACLCPVDGRFAEVGFSGEEDRVCLRDVDMRAAAESAPMWF